MINHMLPGFTPIKPSNNTNDECTLTIADKYVFLNKQCFLNFKGCPFLEFMINKKDHLLAVKKVPEKTSHAVRVSVSKTGYSNISNASIVNQIKVVDVRSKKTKHVTASTVNDWYIIFDLGD